MDLTLEYVSRIKYYCRNGYIHESLRVSEDALQKFPNESIFKFYKGIGLFLLRKNNDALRLLEPLEHDRAFSLGGCVAAVAAHKACMEIDQETVASLEAKIRLNRKTASAEELCYAGIFMSLIGKPDKAKEYLDRATMQSTPPGSQVEILCAKGWLELQLAGKEKREKSAADFFEAVLKENKRHLDALLGVAHHYEMSHRFESAMDKLNLALAVLPNWVPALVEKLKIGLSNSPGWDQAQDDANRILGIEDNLEARRIKILYVLCREGAVDTVVSMLQEFFLSCKKSEPQNSKYFMENARLFSQLASYSKEILRVAMEFAKFAAELEIDNSEYLTDVGKIHLLMGNGKEASHEFKQALEMDKTSLPALYGLTSCQLVIEENLNQASQQLEFLRELGTSTPELFYLSAIVARRRNQKAETVLKFLSEAIDVHFAKMKGIAFNLEYLKMINSDLVLKIVKEYLHFAPQEPLGPGMPNPLPVKQADMILDTVMKVQPCHRDALFVRAQVRYLSGDPRSAIATLEELKKIDSSLLDVHLLLAQIHVNVEEFDQASFALDDGISSNFKIHENPKYQLLLAKIQRHKGDVKKAIKTLSEALAAIKRGSAGETLSQSDKMSLYMELIALQRQQGNLEEANILMQKTLDEFKGTSLEGRIGLTQAEEMMEKGEFDKALALLRAVQPEQSHFVQARKLMADIHLNYRPNNEQYINCYTDIVNSDPIPANLIMLADAYMTIEEPDKAIEMYELALAKNPRDPTLASKMGQALILTHQYSKAINYFKDGSRNDDTFSLRFDLSTLYLKLKQWDKAEKTIQQALTEITKESKLNNVIMEVKFLILLAKVLQGSGNIPVAQQSLVRAKESQLRVMRRIHSEQPSNANEQNVQFCTICKLLGDVAEKQNEIDFAIRSLKEALEICSDDWQCLIVLAKLYMKGSHHVQCQQTCQQLLKVKKDCVEASLMLGELYFRKADFNSSSFHFQQFLDRNPRNWKSLMWFIECGRRMGNMGEAEGYLKAASSHSEPNDPGFAYCQGMFEWYSGNSNAALKMLNKARKDPAYASKAVMTMIEIYVNPTGQVLGGEALESSAAGDSLANGGSGGGKADYRDATLNTTDTLLNELNPKGTEEKFRRHILENFVLIATKNKAKVEKATQELAGLLTTESGKESVMLVYALATGYMFAKQTPKARNQLKRISKSGWSFEEAEYLERCWLLLADIYIGAAKYDLASELIQKVLQYNKSCFKANEYYGFIMEKEQSYADAALSYEAAWKLTNLSNPAMGYKLAFNYLKAKRYTDAIDVCHTVLSKYPTYPKIKKEILDKARANLRP